MAVLNRNMLNWGQIVSCLVIALIYVVELARAEVEPFDKSDNLQTTSPVPSLHGHVVEETDSTEKPPLTDPGFIHAFIASLSVIIVSELGDKTFFIAAIMAMKHSRLAVFAGAMSALGLMTVLSAVFGWIATVIPRVYTYYVSAALFAVFGLKMLRDGYYMSPNEGQEELEEVQSDLRRREEEVAKKTASQRELEADLVAPAAESAVLDADAAGRTEGSPTVADELNPEGRLESDKKNDEFDKDGVTVVPDVEVGLAPSGVKRKVKSRAGKFSSLSRVIAQAFMLTFLAEWGDRSQIATIVMAASYDIFGITVGGVLGHALCTGVAVLGGRMIAQRISVRTVTIIGGVVFLIFAISALFIDPN